MLSLKSYKALTHAESDHGSHSHLFGEKVTQILAWTGARMEHLHPLEVITLRS